ncbi:MAG: DUF2892 domain-containing protein [Bacteroidetes bacterium]|nr:DUF2892 domain-containing protein [Bacteroidota bacterium]
MKRNMGNLDRALRVVAALVIVALYFTGVISGPLGIGLLAVAVVFVLTSIIGTCPLYLPFGINTSDKK